MRFLPPRRWLQFRMSTCFVLVGIVGWAMMCWPDMSQVSVIDTAINETPQPDLHVPPEAWRTLGFTPPKAEPEPLYLAHRIGLSKFLWYWKVKTFLNGETWPLLALIAFLGWKAAWVVVERRRRRAAAPE